MSVCVREREEIARQDKERESEIARQDKERESESVGIGGREGEFECVYVGERDTHTQRLPKKGHN